MTLGAKLAAGPIVLAPGVYDPLSATIAAQSGFEALYLSGAAVAYTRLGRPDIGLVSVSEVADTLALINDIVDLPLIVDADTGFGNALNMQRTVRTFERCGASAMQIEDQTFPKRCGHLSEKSLVPVAEMVGKIHAALDSRHDEATLIIARTDAIAVEGFEKAIERAHAYSEAGADVLFIEAPGSLDQLRQVGSNATLGKPLMANMVEGGKTPILPASELEAMGYSLVIFPAGIVRAIAHTAREFYGLLERDGTTDKYRDRMLDFMGLNGLIGTTDILEQGKKYQ